ncbi:MAG TPA: Flp pilus assembly protein CpaB [Anaerolineaceae bacterium]|nr:Flp pilus assembly protein CpaB [Anaerolineaceae bacterium]HQH84097.1 Flp pilus assembly protein CpaB [Anaerolineaceae bacterium]
MKKLIPVLLAAAAFIAALILNRPEKTVSVVTAAADLPAGRELVAADLALREIPAAQAPDGSLDDISQAVGLVLRMPRAAGDPILIAQLSEERIELEPGERALAIKVNDAGGLAGLIALGDRVGLTAVIRASEGTYSKYIGGGFRILYISPDFAADQAEPAAASTPAATGFGSTASTTAAQRTDEGIVVIAVPAAAQVLLYDFAPFGAPVESQMIFLLDLIPALDQSADVELSLSLEGREARDAETSGVYLPALVVTPKPTPGGYTAPTAVPEN